MTSWFGVQDALELVEALSGNPRARYAAKPGAKAASELFVDLPAPIYHADRDALSCSMLKPLLKSPAHFQLASSTVSPSTDAKDFGTLVHLLLLEPQNTSRELAVYPGVGNLRDRDYKVFLANNSHRLAVDEPTFEKARRLVQKIGASRFKGRAIHKFIEESLCEASLYFTEPASGLRLRTRFDAFHPDISFDLKTTRHPDPAGFARDAVEFGYDLQAHMYSLGRMFYEDRSTPAPFVFLTAETAPPFSVYTHTAGESFMENGAAKFRECLVTFQACSAVQHWPDRSCDSVLEISPWQQFQSDREWSRI